MFLLLLSKLTLAYNFYDFSYFGSWKEKPNIIEVCDDSNVSIETIKNSIEFWKSNGQIRHNIEIKKTSQCDAGFREGKITITSRKIFDIKKYYAMTYHQRSKDNLFKASRIEIDTLESDNLVLITHEIGHALGIDHSHSNDKEHIMYYKVLTTPTRMN